MPAVTSAQVAKWLKKLVAERSWKVPEELAESGMGYRKRFMEEVPEAVEALSSSSVRAVDKPLLDVANARVRRAKQSGKTVKPRLDLTGPQWQKMMERILLKTEGTPGKGDYKVGSAGLPQQYGPEARQMMDELAPATNRIYSRLNERKMIGGNPHEVIKQPRDLPYGEAIEQLARDPKRFTAERYSLPQGNVMSYGDDPGYEKRTFRPVGEVVERARSAAEEIQKELALSATEKARKAEALLQKQATQTSAGTGQAAITNVQKAVGAENTEGLSIDLIKQGVALDQIWKYLVKGLKTQTGKEWKLHLMRQGGRGKGLQPRDYFLRQGMRWLENPEEFAKRYPKEAQSIEVLWRRYEEL